MQILSIQNYQYNNFTKIQPQATFGHGGKPITLEYVVKNRAQYLPERVLVEAKKVLADVSVAVKPTLLDLHKRIYAPLLECTTLDEAKAIFPEFEPMTDTVKFKRVSKFSKDFYNKTDSNFALKMLQEVWANAKSMEQIAKDFGMNSRTTLVWPLQQINFISIGPKYINLLRASDAEGNKVIAAKTTAWNQLHPDLMQKKNKHAAQACKTEEYRQAQRERMLEYDLNHPERAQKISEFGKEMWSKAPEVRKAMSDFFAKEPPEVRRLLAKRSNGYPLRTAERRIIKGAYERFWQSHSELKEVLSNARKEVAEARKNK